MWTPLLLSSPSPGADGCSQPQIQLCPSGCVPTYIRSTGRLSPPRQGKTWLCPPNLRHFLTGSGLPSFCPFTPLALCCNTYGVAPPLRTDLEPSPTHIHTYTGRKATDPLPFPHPRFPPLPFPYSPCPTHTFGKTCDSTKMRCDLSHSGAKQASPGGVCMPRPFFSLPRSILLPPHRERFLF